MIIELKAYVIGFRDESETTAWILYTITQSFAILKTTTQGIA